MSGKKLLNIAESDLFKTPQFFNLVSLLRPNLMQKFFFLVLVIYRFFYEQRKKDKTQQFAYLLEYLGVNQTQVIETWEKLSHPQ